MLSEATYRGQEGNRWTGPTQDLGGRAHSGELAPMRTEVVTKSKATVLSSPTPCFQELGRTWESSIPRGDLSLRQDEGPPNVGVPLPRTCERGKGTWPRRLSGGSYLGPDLITGALRRGGERRGAEGRGSFGCDYRDETREEGPASSDVSGLDGARRRGRGPRSAGGL